MSDHVDRRHPLTLVVALAIIVSALGGALYMMRRADARVQAMNVEEVETVIPVDVFVARRVSIPRMIEARGFLRGIEEITVHSEVAGRVVSRAVAEGDRVKRGDILLTVDDTFHALSVQRSEAEQRRAQAQLGEARAGIRQAEARLDSARAVRANRADEFERIETLHASGHAPKIEYDRIATAFRTAEADLAAADAALARVIDQRATAEAVVAVTQATLEEAKAYLERCIVRAPVTGRVHRFFIEPGEYAMLTAPLVEVVRLDRMKVVVEVADTDIPLLASFSRSEFTADAADGEVHRARLHHVAPKMDPLSKKFQVELRLANADESLLSGMYGQVILHCGEISDVISIPREAVFKHFGVDFCLLVDGEAGSERAKLRRVVVQDIRGRLDELRLLSGLAVGDRVIVSRRRELQNGVPVKVGRVETE